ncbi:biotin-dependent carboxyltransferase family protein [Bordetella sp. LUAb4]|uniref:5-oxoprolinase subunit C family protein n=1 Tax=Bordetella sp. LUAb4 TaxID=2843195 RepID=UPI001E4B6895|nr:biotin-dependent carboxyltransferase family protein [Bordetella sp. LUAb4]
MIRVLKPGALTQLQDLGRYGYQRYGVPVNGVMDEWSHRVANILVGNDETVATLECTLTGPTLQFQDERLIALCGADMRASVEGVMLPLNEPVLLRRGATLTFGECRRGARLYLAVRGGFDVEPVMGSTSTFARGHFGGFAGRALVKGDRLPLRAADAGYPRARRLLVQCGTPFVSAGVFDLPAQETPEALRAVRGPQWQAFTEEARTAFVSTPFTVDSQSDRMGYRLRGEVLKLTQPLEMISEATAFGTVQVPPDGNPIVLMADRQSAGGYPKIAYVASVDLPRLAQSLPGATLSFATVDMAEAQGLYLAREAALAALREQVTVAMTPPPENGDAADADE